MTTPRSSRRSLTFWLLALLVPVALLAAEWPALPVKDAAAEIPAQEWPQRPGPRLVRALVHYPGGALDGVNAATGIMLTLHNWGGSDCVGTADPRVLAQRLNVVAVCVNYLQSGKADSIDAPDPYDFGYLQALDALRALWWVRDRLAAAGRPFADDRLFCTGGSGGGNVTLMANKLARRNAAGHGTVARGRAPGAARGRNRVRGVHGKIPAAQDPVHARGRGSRARVAADS